MDMSNDNSDYKEDIFSYDFIRQLALSPRLLFGSRYDARFIDCLPQEIDLVGRDMIVMDTSRVIGDEQSISPFLYVLEQGIPIASSVSVFDELALPPPSNTSIVSSRSQKPEIEMKKKTLQRMRKDLLLAVAATGLLFDFKDHYDAPEYRLVEELGQCTSKAFAMRIIEKDFAKWEGYLTHAVRGHQLYAQLFAGEEASEEARGKIFSTIMNAIFMGKPISESKTRSLEGIERPLIATSSIASAINHYKSKMVLVIAQDLSAVVERNSSYVLDADPSEAVRSYGEPRWMRGCKRYINRIIGGSLNRIMDAEVQEKPVEPHTVRYASTRADTESLLLAYLMADKNPKGSILYACNDKTRAMPSFSCSVQERLERGFPFYQNSTPLKRAPNIGFATRDLGHFEALHLLQHISRK